MENFLEKEEEKIEEIAKRTLRDLSFVDDDYSKKIDVIEIGLWQMANFIIANL